MKKKNLIFFLPEFVKGGAGNSIFSLCKNLNKKNFNLNILCLDKCEYKYELSNIAKVYEIKKSKTIFAQSEIARIISQIAKSKYKTIFISNLFHANVLIGLFQKKQDNIKFIFTERTTLSELFIYFGLIDFFKKSIIKFLIKLVYTKADLIIANSKRVAKKVSLYSRSKSIFVYPGSFSKFKKKKYKDRIPKNIIWIGRLSEEKGLEILIDAFQGIDKRKYNLNIIGDGPLKKKIETKVKNYGLKNKIKLLGFKEDIFPYLKKSDLLINTSFFEGFPNVVVEALSQSVPVICSKSNGGIYEILKNGCYGDLFDINKPQSLVLKINKFLNNPSRLRKKASMSKRHLFKFEKKRSAKIYEKIFNSL